MKTVVDLTRVQVTTQVEVEETFEDLPSEQVTTQVEVEETFEDLPPEQVTRVVDLREYRLSEDIDVENPDDLQLHHTMCKISFYSSFIWCSLCLNYGLLLSSLVCPLLIAVVVADP